MSRAGNSAASGAVVLSGLTHVAVAIRQMVRRANSGWRRRPRLAALPAVPPNSHPLHLKPSSIASIVGALRTRDEVLVSIQCAIGLRFARAGFPAVRKSSRATFRTMSEVGGVRVNIASKGEAFAAYQALLESLGRHRPDAAIQGVLVRSDGEKGRRDHRPARCL